MGARGLSELLKRLQPQLSHDERYLLARTVIQLTETKGKHISFEQLARSLEVAGAAAGDWRDEILQKAACAIYRARVQLRRAFRFFDINGDGVVTADEFQQALNTLNALQGMPIDRAQLDELYSSIDTNRDGFIQFDEFIESFRVMDTDAHAPHPPSSPAPMEL